MSAWLDVALRVLIQSTITFAVVWLLIKVFPGISPNVRCWIWRLTVLKCLVGLIVAVPVAILPSPPVLGTEAGIEASVAVAETSISPVAPEPHQVDPWAIVWLIGASVGAVHLLIEGVKIRRFRRSLEPLSDFEEVEISQSLRMRRTPRVFLAPDSLGPFLVGALKPVIALPEGMDPLLRRMALAHELSHAKRRDALWGLAMSLITIAFWFVPGVRLASRFAAEAAEESCDLLALKITKADPAGYAQMLLEFARRPSVRVSALSLSTRRTLERRIKTMISRPKHIHFSAIAPLTLVLALALVPWVATAKSGNASQKESLPETYGWSYSQALLEIPSIQKELEMTKAQVVAQKKINTDYWARFQRFSNELQRQKDNNVSDADRINFDNRERPALYREQNNALMAVLSDDQVSRLRQLTFQITGERALASTSVANLLGIPEAHRQKFYELVSAQRQRHMDLQQQLLNRWREPIRQDLSRLTPTERTQWTHALRRLHLASGQERVKVYETWRKLSSKIAVYSLAARTHKLGNNRTAIDQANKEFNSKVKSDILATNRKINSLLTEDERAKWEQALGAPFDYPEKSSF